MLGDGHCVIEIYQSNPGIAMIETANSREIGEVAWEVLNECTFTQEGYGAGGYAEGLGEPLHDSHAHTTTLDFL